MFILGFFYIRLSIWRLPFGVLGLCVTFALLVGLIMFTLRRRYLSTERYFHLLHQPQAGWELEQFQRITMRRIRILLIIVIFNVIFNHWALVFPPALPSQWFAYSVILSIFLWGMSLFIDYLQITQLRQELMKMDAPL